MDVLKYENELTRCEKELAARLGIEEVPNEVWGYVMKLKLPLDVVNQGDEASWRELVQEAKQCLQRPREEPRSTTAPLKRDQRSTYEKVTVKLSKASRERSQALSEVAAALATLHPRVRRFRENCLGAPMKTLSAAEAEEVLGHDEYGRLSSWRYLEDDLSSPWVHMLLPPRMDLAGIAEELCKLYGWREGDAERFVLSGYIPPVDPLTVCVHGPDSWRHEADCNYFLKTARITLTMHAWVRAEDVERAFRDVQRQILGGDNRPLGERILPAVRFVAQQILEHGQRERWNVLWKQWNKKCPPERRYKSYRELRQAFARFIYPNYGVPKVENALPEITPHVERLRKSVSEWALDKNEP